VTVMVTVARPAGTRADPRSLFRPTQTLESIAGPAFQLRPKTDALSS